MKNINILKYTVAAGLAIASLSSCDLDLVPEDAIQAFIKDVEAL